MLPVNPVATNVVDCPGANSALLGFTVRISCGVSVVFVQPEIAIAIKEKMMKKYLRSNVLFLR